MNRNEKMMAVETSDSNNNRNNDNKNNTTTDLAIVNEGADEEKNSENNNNDNNNNSNERNTNQQQQQQQISVDELLRRRQRFQKTAGSRGLSVQGSMMNFQIPGNQDAQDHAEEMHGTDSWRYKYLKIIHSTKMQFLLMSLLLLDVLILFVELFLLASYPHCSIVRRDAISCCPITDDNNNDEHRNNNNEQHDNLRWLSATEDEHHHSVCKADSHAAYEYEAGCDGHKWSNIHALEEALFGLTIFILSFFMIELNLTMIALQPQIFFRQFFFLLDYIIITISLIMEITFHIFNDDLYQSLTGLLVLIRIWRFVRIGHGIVEVTHEMSHKHFTHLLTYTEALEDVLTSNGIPLPESQFRSSMRGGSSDADDGAGDSGDGNLLSQIEKAHRAEERKKYQETLNINQQQQQQSSSVDVVSPADAEQPVVDGSCGGAGDYGAVATAAAASTATTS